ncbi:NADPH-dependent FMN reductase [Xylariomycetidae sp. FL0641]|nr:NADPH-dependent FMN reductase [Xylariomycetidae sp. FL0641]
MASKIFRIGVINGSARTPQAGSQITDFIQALVQKHAASSSSSSSSSSSPAKQYEFQRLNVKDLPIPFADDPTLPKVVKDSSGYASPATQAWSRTVTALDAFVVVTPEYNASFPGGLKIALDAIWHEWGGKPAMLVSYGGGGGGKGAYDALRNVCAKGLAMRVVDTPVNLKFPGFEILLKGANGQDIGLDIESDEAPFADARPTVAKAVGELLELLPEA